MLSKEAFAEWLDNPATLEILAALRIRAQLLSKTTLTHVWASGLLTPEQQVDVALIKGKVQMLQDIASWTPEDFDVVSLEKESDKSGW
jgi:hypothetical protein